MNYRALVRFNLGQRFSAVAVNMPVGQRDREGEGRKRNKGGECLQQGSWF